MMAKFQLYNDVCGSIEPDIVYEADTSGEAAENVLKDIGYSLIEIEDENETV
ncbi:MAG: hypothetical protein JW720_13235 [Sedimentisphaerales bacterium]|nr:hypothetical protein [Sedimentisphaerales bacterium]